MTSVNSSFWSQTQEAVGASDIVGLNVGIAVVGAIETVGCIVGAPFAHCATKAPASTMPAPSSAVNGPAVS